MVNSCHYRRFAGRPSGRKVARKFKKKKILPPTTIYSSVPVHKNSDLAGTLRTAFQRFRSGTVQARASKGCWWWNRKCSSAETPGLLQRVSRRLYDVLPLSARIRNVSHRYCIQTVLVATPLSAHTHQQLSLSERQAAWSL